MSQTFRIAVGAATLVPILAAFLLTGFPANAATYAESPSLRDQRISNRIDRTVKEQCRHQSPGSVEHSICLAEGRKDLYRAAASSRDDRKDQQAFAPR